MLIELSMMLLIGVNAIEEVGFRICGSRIEVRRLC